MARSNTGSQSNKLSTTNVPITGLPVTIACWFNPVNLTTNNNLVFIRQNGNGDTHYVGLIYDGANANAQGDNVVLATSNTTVEVLAPSPTGGTAGQWMHCAAVFASTTSRTGYLNGVGGTANTTSNAPSFPFTGGVDVGTITTVGGSFSPINGSIADVAIWDVALTASEIAALAKGASPLSVRPANLVRFWPITGRFSPEPDFLSTNALTITGTMAQASHPPGLKRPQDATIPDAPAAGGGSTAAGATVTEQTSLVTGSATGAASSTAATVTLNASLIAGAATGAASAAAATVTQDRSLVSGAATGAAAGAGATVTLSGSLIAGAATGAATAAAATVTQTAALIATPATVGVTVAGATISLATTLVAGAATGAASRAAATVSLNTSLITGAATGAATVAAATVSLNTSLIAGAETGAASAAGATVSETTSVIAGSVSAGGTGNASGVTVSLAASLIAGAATGAASAAAATVTQATSLLAGSATAATTAPGATVTATASFIAGAKSGAALASGVTVTEGTSLIAGAATSGSVSAQSAVAPPVRASFDQTGAFWDSTSTTFDAESTRVFPAARFAFVPGAAAVNRTGQGVTLTATVSLIAGAAVADSAPVAAGKTFSAVTTLLAGAASSAEPAMVSGTTFTLAASLIAGAASGAVTTSSAITWDQTSPTWDTTSVTFDQTTGAGAGAGAGSFIGTPTYSFIPGTAIGASSAAGVTFETRASFMAHPANVLDAPGTAQGATVTAVLSLVPGRARGQGWRKHPHGGPSWTNVDKPGGEWTVVQGPGGAWNRAA